MMYGLAYWDDKIEVYTNWLSADREGFLARVERQRGKLDMADGIMQAVSNHYGAAGKQFEYCVVIKDRASRKLQIMEGLVTSRELEIMEGLVMQAPQPQPI